MIADPRAVAARWGAPRLRMLAELAERVSDAPWTLSADHRQRAHAAGLSDDEILHAVALSALFGHLNRIADAVDVALDYEVRQVPPRAEPATPPLAVAPGPVSGAPVMTIDARPATAAALAAWRDHVARDPASAAIAGWVAGLVGDGPAVPDDGSPVRRLVDTVTRAPWQLGDAAYAPLRALGHDDAAVFRICAAASAHGAFARIRVALIALGR